MTFVRKKTFAVSFFLCLLVSAAVAQPPVDHQTADLLRHRNYGSALPSITEQLAGQPNQPLLNYYAGLCYLHSRSQKPRAAAYLEKAIEHSQWWRNNSPAQAHEAPEDAHKLLGDAYYYALKFDAAVRAYEKYGELNAGKRNDSLAKEVAVKIAMCRYLKDFRPGVSLPLSARTGSPCADLVYGTMTGTLSPDKSTMTYLLKVPVGRLEKLPDDAQYFEETHLPPSTDTSGRKQKKPENKKYVERDTVMYASTVGTSYDGQVTLTYRNDEGQGNLYISRLRDNKWSAPVKMKKAANPAGWEPFESISPDGKQLYFASDRPGGYGGMDLYRCTMQADGQWSKAMNLGPAVNTGADETAPFIHADGATLFFSSNRNRPGSYDIYSATASVANHWTTPRNVGFPVNRNEQDIFQVDADRKRMLGSAPAGRQRPSPDSATSARSIAVNEEDNYLITFTGQQGEALHLRSGAVRDVKTAKPVKAAISVIDNSTGAELARYYSNPQNGHFSLILPAARDLQVVFEEAGYLPLSEHIDVTQDKNHFEQFQTVGLARIESGASCTLHNVFFESEKTTPSASSRHELERVAELLLSDPGTKVRIESRIYTPDNRKFYKRLSKDRARALMGFLQEKGVPDRQLSADWSASKPVKEKQKKDDDRGKKKSRIKKREPIEKEDIKPVQQTILIIQESEKNK